MVLSAHGFSFIEIGCTHEGQCLSSSGAKSKKHVGLTLVGTLGVANATSFEVPADIIASTRVSVDVGGLPRSIDPGPDESRAEAPRLPWAAHGSRCRRD